jgi:predicted RecB family nuclease
VLELFWDAISLDKILSDEEVKTKILDVLHTEFNKKWKKSNKKLQACNLSEADYEKFYNESIDMLTTFGEDVAKRVTVTSDYSKNLSKIRPIVECELKSDELSIKGRIDVIKTEDNRIEIMDYKTSKEPKITPEYKLQMSVYAMLYESTYGVRPNVLSVYFLKHGVVYINVDDELMKWAKETVEDVLQKIKEGNSMNDFPMFPTVLCRWDSANSKGACDFYSECWPKNDFINGRHTTPKPLDEQPIIKPIKLEMGASLLSPDASLKQWAVEQAVVLLAAKLQSSHNSYTSEQIAATLDELTKMILDTLK